MGILNAISTEYAGNEEKEINLVIYFVFDLGIYSIPKWGILSSKDLKRKQKGENQDDNI